MTKAIAELQAGYKKAFGEDIKSVTITELKSAGKEVDAAADEHLLKTGEEVSYDSRWF